MSDPVISLTQVAVVYRQRRSLLRHEYYEALQDISFDIQQGETVGIIGRNGAGKSTLLRLLAGIIAPDRGRVENRAKRTALLTLQAGFDPNLSGRDNAILSGMLLGYRRRTVVAQLEDIKRYSELGDFFEKPIRTYSTGMRSRLGFAIARHLTPEVLLIDEVLGVGDNQFRQKAVDTMHRMINSQQTVVIVSHSAGELARLCDRLVWIEGGRVAAIGEPRDILRQYHGGAPASGSSAPRA